MIPRQYISPRHFSALLEYAREEINRALAERRALEEKWLKYHRMYKTIPEFAVKQFPFLGAANVVLPIGAIDTDTIFSRLMGIIWGPENLWSCRPLREDAVEYAPRLQEFLRWAQYAELGAYNAVADWLLELNKLGTAVLKQRYRRESRLTYEFRETPAGTVERFARQMVKDNPVLEHVSLYDFLVPAGTVDHQLCPWNAERIMLTDAQLVQRARAGIYTNIERVIGLAGDQPSWVQNELNAQNLFRTGLQKPKETWEFWTDWDISGSGEPMPIVCSLHLPSMTYFRADWNPFFHQERPFEVARYLRQEKQFYGIGVMEMQEMVQEEATAMHNQRLDNATLANTVMMKARKGIGIKEDEPILAGRWFLVDDMDDVQSLTWGRNFDTSIQNENMLMGYGARRTGVNDYVMGASTPAVGYATAQTNIMQHQEAARRFDQTLREVRIALGNSGRRIVELYQQFNSGGKEFVVLGPKDGAIVHQFLQFPTELIRHSVSVEVTATSAALNKESQIRTQSILMQLTTQWYEQAFQGMMLAVNPQLPEPLRRLAYQMVVSGQVMTKRLLESYDQQDVDRIVPDMQEILLGQQQQFAGAGLPLGGGQFLGGPVGPAGFGAQPAPGAGGQGGYAGLLQPSGMAGF